MIGERERQGEKRFQVWSKCGSGPTRLLGFDSGCPNGKSPYYPCVLRWMMGGGGECEKEGVSCQHVQGKMLQDHEKRGGDLGDGDEILFGVLRVKK